MKSWFFCVLVAMVMTQPLHASEPACDSLPPELVRLHSEGRLTVRALWAWRMVPGSTAAMAVQLRDLGHDLLDADKNRIAQWLGEAGEGKLDLTREQREFLLDLRDRMAPSADEETMPDEKGEDFEPSSAVQDAPASAAEKADSVSSPPHGTPAVMTKDVPAAGGAPLPDSGVKPPGPAWVLLRSWSETSRDAYIESLGYEPEPHFLEETFLTKIEETSASTAWPSRVKGEVRHFWDEPPKWMLSDQPFTLVTRTEPESSDKGDNGTHFQWIYGDSRLRNFDYWKSSTGDYDWIPQITTGMYRKFQDAPVELTPRQGKPGEYLVVRVLLGAINGQISGACNYEYQWVDQAQ